MYRIDNQYAATNLPTPAPQGPPGYFTGGDPTTGESATIVDTDWLNTVQEELMNIILKGGVTSDKTQSNQVLIALANLFTGALINITVSQNILVPAWATRVYFRLVGGGGGGAHCQANAGNYVSGGGGGSGAYLEAQRNCTPGQLLAAVVGAGGTSEQNGGATSLSFPGQWSCTAGGGSASNWYAPQGSAGAGGGVASGGDLNSAGGFGGDGQAGTPLYTGYGAAGPWGGGVRAADGAGFAGAGPGAGGAGAYDTGNTDNYIAGGTGAGGLIQYRFMP